MVEKPRVTRRKRLNTARNPRLEADPWASGLGYCRQRKHGDENVKGVRRLSLPALFDHVALHLHMCILSCMRTNIEIDDKVMREAQLLIGARTKRETVDTALREMVARHRRIGVLDLRGKVRWEGDLSESRGGR